MPATSRSGERFGAARAAAAPARPRSRGPPSRASREHGLAEVEVAVGADHRPPTPTCEQRAAARARPGRGRRSAPAPRRPPAGRGRLARSARRRRGEERQRLDVGSSGAKAGSEASEPSAVCSSPITAPSAARRSSKRVRVAAPSSSSASSQPSRAPGRNSCRIAERRVDRAAVDLVPAGQRGDVREAARGQEAQQLELRVDARLDAPERLQDQLVAEDDRRVGLLDADRPHVDVRRPRGRVVAQRNGERRPRLDVVVVAHAVQQLAAGAGSASAS